MNTVEPIRDIDMVNDIADYLKCRNYRDYAMFMFGIYSGLRISDILLLHVRDVRNKEYIYIREMKTGKEKRFPLNQSLINILIPFIQNRKDYEFLFQSAQGKNKAISRQQAYNILSNAGKAFGLDNIGTHTLRKTFGYHLYKSTHDIATIKEIMNHTDVSVTMRYIGITQDIKDDAILSISYKK